MLGLWNKSDSLFSPKLFKFMLMIPTNRDELSTSNQESIHTDYKQTNILESDVHPTDLAGPLIKDFLIKGGKSASAHIISKSQELASAFKNFIVDLQPNTSTQKIDLVHRGKKLSTFKTFDLYSCLERNPELGAKISRKETGEYKLSVGEAQMTFSQEQFNPYKTFLEDVCYLVEYAKLNYNDFNNNTLIYHLESYVSVVNSLYKDAFLKVLNNALESFKNTISKTFGDKNVDFLVSMFTQTENGSLPKLDHSRILSEEADTGNSEPELKAPTTDDAGYTIRLVSGVIMFFLYFYVCVYIYDINVYKDSLIYSNLLTTKKK